MWLATQAPLAVGRRDAAAMVAEAERQGVYTVGQQQMAAAKSGQWRCWAAVPMVAMLMAEDSEGEDAIPIAHHDEVGAEGFTAADLEEAVVKAGARQVGEAVVAAQGRAKVASEKAAALLAASEQAETHDAQRGAEEATKAATAAERAERRQALAAAHEAGDAWRTERSGGEGTAAAHKTAALQADAELVAARARGAAGTNDAAGDGRMGEGWPRVQRRLLRERRGREGPQESDSAHALPAECAGGVLLRHTSLEKPARTARGSVRHRSRSTRRRRPG